MDVPRLLRLVLSALSVGGPAALGYPVVALIVAGALVLVLMGRAVKAVIRVWWEAAGIGYVADRALMWSERRREKHGLPTLEDSSWHRAHPPPDR